MTRSQDVRAAGLAVAVVLVCVTLNTGCGGGGSNGSPTTPTPPPAGNSGGSGGGGGTTPTITITGSGASPQEITIAQGQRVRFVNNDTREHDMNSDPHPSHGSCPEIDNSVGFLAAGQSKETANFVSAKSCGYHDHNQPSNASLTGRIIVR
jgi:plastocyanin